VQNNNSYKGNFFYNVMNLKYNSESRLYRIMDFSRENLRDFITGKIDRPWEFGMMETLWESFKEEAKKVKDGVYFALEDFPVNGLPIKRLDWLGIQFTALKGTVGVNVGKSVYSGLSDEPPFPNNTGLFNLATLSKEACPLKEGNLNGSLVLKINEHSDMDVNPQFLYDLGDNFGQRIR